jgi:hypothetical protein
VPFGQIKEVRPENRNPITYELPKLVFDELYSEFGKAYWLFLVISKMEETSGIDPV